MAYRIYFMIPLLIVVFVASFIVPFPMNIIQAFVAGLSLGSKIAMLIIDRDRAPSPTKETE